MLDVYECWMFMSVGNCFVLDIDECWTLRSVGHS